MNEYKDELNFKTAFKKILNNLEKFNETCSFPEKSFHEKKLFESGTSLSETAANCDNISKDNCEQSVSFHGLTLDEKPTGEFSINSIQYVKSNKKRTSSFSESNKSDPVPEWNTAFKDILGENSSSPVLGNQKKQENLQICDNIVNTRSTLRNFCKIPKPVKQESLQTCDTFSAKSSSRNFYKKQESLQTCATLVSNNSTSRNFYKKQKDVETCNTSVNTKPTQRKKFSRVPKSKDPEEEKVIELFARSRMFKLDRYNLNDFEGAGIDIFKSDKNSFFESNKAEFTAVQYEPDSKPLVPLKGFVAKYKPYTTADLIASPCVPFDEPAWDNEFLF